jgi:Escherichia/Staphylococcus phage prohead protease
MTTAELEQEQTYAVRTYAVDLVAGDGRTVDVRIAPYGETIQHNDGLGFVPRGIVYDEEILPGCFDHQLSAAHRVLVNVEHEQGVAGIVGRGLALRSAADGFYGSFRMLDTPGGDTTLELVREEALGGVSFEALFVKSLRAANGVCQRARANLRNIALVRTPAYSRAVVLGLREEPVVLLREEMLPLPFDAELAERIEALGLEVPERLKSGHPAIGTPAQTGTPAGGTPDSTSETTIEEVARNERAGGSSQPSS